MWVISYGPLDHLLAGSIESQMSGWRLDRNIIIDSHRVAKPDGEPTRGIMKFIDELRKLYLKGKWVAVFDSYLGRDLEGLKKMEKRIGE